MSIQEAFFNHHQWQSAFDVLPTGVVLINAKGVVDKVNGAARNFLGDDVCGKPWIEVITACFAPKKDDGHEISLKDGRRLHVSISSMPDSTGEIIMLTDLTLTRAFEQEKARAERLQEMGEMLAHLAHQIRTPLASAMLYSNNLKHEGLGSEKRALFLSKIQYCHHNIEQQIQDLLVFAKGGGSLLQGVNMHTFLNAIKTKAEVKLQEQKGELIIDNHVNGLTFICQSDALSGAISNLIDNALNAGATKVYLNVIVSADNFLIFTVVDNGQGMSEKVLKESTRPFYTTRAKGTGLGLAVVSAVAKSHQGELSIMSKLGSGSTFSISIPLLKEQRKVEAQ